MSNPTQFNTADSVAMRGGGGLPKSVFLGDSMN